MVKYGSMLKFIRNILNGLAFGITETIPGVSAGTIAIILGYYFELIETINHFTENLKKNLGFAIPLLIGIVSGVLLFSSVMHFLLTYYSFPTMLFFIGLIVGIIPHIFSKVVTREEKHSVKDSLLVFIPFALVIIISALKGASVTDPENVINSMGIPFMIFIFFAGILAAAALVIPGISGSFVLLLLGIYPLVIFSLSSIRVLITDIKNVELLLSICKVLIPLGIGIIIGGLSMVRMIEMLLKKHEKILYSIILGLLLGSICVLFMSPIVYKSGVTSIFIVIGIFTFSFGVVSSFLLGRKRL